MAQPIAQVVALVQVHLDVADGDVVLLEADRVLVSPLCPVDRLVLPFKELPRLLQRLQGEPREEGIGLHVSKMASMAAASLRCEPPQAAAAPSPAPVYSLRSAPLLFFCWLILFRSGHSTISEAAPARWPAHLAAGECAPLPFRPLLFPLPAKTPRKTIGFSLPFGLILLQLLCYDKV